MKQKLLKSEQPAKLKKWPDPWKIEEDIQGRGYIIYIHGMPIMNGETGEPEYFTQQNVSDQLLRTISRLSGVQIKLKP